MMIYFLTASHPEAVPIIKHYGMKKDMTHKRMQFYRAEGVKLIISGSGAVNTAASAAYLLAFAPPGDGDIFVNIGVCGAAGNFISGEIVVCNKITDIAAGTVFYPELLYAHPFKESVLVSFPCKPEQNKTLDYNSLLLPDGLADTNGAFFFQAVIKLMPIHNVFVIRIVSGEKIFDENIQDSICSLTLEGFPQIFTWLDSVASFITTAGIIEQDVLSEEENEAVIEICKNLKFSIYMKKEIIKLFHRYIKRNNDVTVITQKYIPLAAKDKKEGITFYEQLRKDLLE